LTPAGIAVVLGTLNNENASTMDNDSGGIQEVLVICVPASAIDSITA
jgi:hypothetical protein